MTPRTALAALVAVLVVGCGAADPAASLRSRPLEERLVEVEARRLCELQATTFTSPEEAEAFVDDLLREADVTRSQLEAFRDDLAADPTAAAEVSDLVAARCG